MCGLLCNVCTSIITSKQCTQTISSTWTLILYTNVFICNINSLSRKSCTNDTKNKRKFSPTVFDYRTQFFPQLLSKSSDEVRIYARGLFNWMGVARMWNALLWFKYVKGKRNATQYELCSKPLYYVHIYAYTFRVLLERPFHCRTHCNCSLSQNKTHTHSPRLWNIFVRMVYG